MGCSCGKQIAQYGIFNVYFESLNLPSFLIGLVMAVIGVYTYEYCKRSRKHYKITKGALMCQTLPPPPFPPRYSQPSPPPWSKSAPYPVAWNPGSAP